ncbi:MAG: hypothetical protein K9W44_07850 [Candidatus Lokiarchaeota archaeon]|nr:hypothetical protein [Candidatus Harpocratesius repetitus]
MSENQDTMEFFNQDFYSQIHRLKKQGQFYTLTRLVAGFIRTANDYNLDVSEYEYWLTKYYKAERTEKDMLPHEIDVLLASYEDRLRTIIKYQPIEHRSNKSSSTLPISLNKQKSSHLLNSSDFADYSNNLDSSSASNSLDNSTSSTIFTSNEDEQMINSIVDKVLNESSKDFVEVDSLKKFSLKNGLHPFENQKD